MALRVPVVVVRPAGVLDASAAAQYPVVLVDHGDAERAGHAAQDGVRAAVRASVLVRGENDDRGSVAVGAPPEFGERPRGELERLGEEGRRVVHQVERVPVRTVVRRLPAVEDPPVAGAGGQQLGPPGERGPPLVGEPGAPAGVEPAREQRAAGQRPRRRLDPVRARRRDQTPQPGHRVLRVSGVGRAQPHAPVLRAFGEGEGRAVGVPAPADRLLRRGVVGEIVVEEDQNQQVGAQRTRVLVVVRQLVGLPRALPPPRRGGDVQLRQRGGRQRLEAHVQLVGDRDLARVHVGVAEDGDVAARRGARRIGRLAVEEAEAVRALHDPVVEAVGVAHLGVRLVEHAHARHEARGRGAFLERRRGQPQPRLAREGDQREAAEDQRRVPARDARQPDERRGSTPGRHAAPDRRTPPGGGAASRGSPRRPTGGPAASSGGRPASGRPRRARRGSRSTRAGRARGCRGVRPCRAGRRIRGRRGRPGGARTGSRARRRRGRCGAGIRRAPRR